MELSDPINRREFLQLIGASVPLIITYNSFASERGMSQLSTDTGIIDTSSSPAAKLHGVPVKAASLNGGLLHQRRESALIAGMPAFFHQLERVGAIDKIRGRKTQARGNSDADIAKWLEAAAYWVQSDPDDAVKTNMESVVAAYESSNKSDGYLRERYYTNLPGRLKEFKAGGDLYCLGHLIQAAVSHYRATGEDTLVSIFSDYVDHLAHHMDFTQTAFNVAHPEIEMALVELHRVTGNKRHLDIAEYLITGIDLRRHPSLADKLDYEHIFTGVPFTTHRELSDHAVCAMYMVCGATDYYLETGTREIRETMDKLWEDLTQSKMYVTGGVGSRPQEEAIGSKYELPNETNYAETCAAIGNMMWNWRLLQSSGEAQHMDVFERVLYNGMLSGISLRGDTFFYWNPLLSRAKQTRKALEETREHERRLIGEKKINGIGVNVRQPYYSTPCCPPNILRMLGSLPGYMYSTSSEGIWIHLFQESRLTWQLESGLPISVTQKTNYPWEGQIDIQVEPESPQEFSLFVRIPAWAPSAEIHVNKNPVSEPCSPGQYYTLHRVWKPGDQITIELAMPVRIIYANPLVQSNIGKVALQRGPVMYCLESIDNPETSLFDIVLPLEENDTTNRFQTTWRPDLLDGVVTITTEALAHKATLDSKPLYGDYETYYQEYEPVTITAIPYYAWANRGISDMRVWIPTIPSLGRD